MKKDESLSATIVRGSTITLVSAGINKILNLLFYFAVLRFVLPEEAGLFFLGIAVLGFVSILPSFGISASIQRFVPYYIGQNKTEKLNPLIKNLCFLMFMISIVTSAIIILLAHEISSFYGIDGVEPIIIIAAVITPFALFYPFILSFFRGVSKFGMASLIEALFAVLRLVLLLIFVLFISAQASHLMLSLLITFALTCLFGLVFVFTELKQYKTDPNASVDMKEIIGYGIPIYLASFGILITNWTDTLFLGYFIGPAVVAGYNAVLLISRNVGPIVSSTLSGVVKPVMSKLYGEKSKNFWVLGSYATKWYLVLGIPLLTAFIAFPRPLLSLIFPKYVEYYWLLYILAPTFFSSLIARPFADALAAVGRTDIFLKVSAIILVPNILLNWLLIPQFGVLGAAVATSLSFIVSQFIYIYYGRSITHIYFHRDIWKPVLAAILSFFSVKLISMYVSADLIGILQGAVVGGFVYVSIILISKFFDPIELKIIKNINRLWDKTQ